MNENNKIEERIEKTTTKRDLNEDVQREKKASKAQKMLPILIVSCVALLVILGAVLIAFYQLKKTDKQNAKTLESVYSSSYYSMVDSVNNLQVNADKFETLTTSMSQRSLLKDMEQDCSYIIAGLSVLPIDAQNSNSAIKFFNQLSGVCEAYITAIDKGEELTSEQLLLIDKAEQALSIIKSKLNTHNDMVKKGEYEFITNGIFNSEGVTQFSNSIGDLTSNEVDYPTMIFDGPFSAALENKEIKGLSEVEVSQEEAYEYLKNTVYKNDDVQINFVTETSGDFDTYDFEIIKNKITYTAQVSKRQGLLLNLCGYAEKEDANISSEQAQQMAINFAKKAGFGDLVAVWVEVNENVAYINLAPTQDGVILYPDLVKVKVDLASQQIIGFEAVNYAFNHTQREPEFNLTTSECEEVLGFDYNILKTSKTVIRLDGGREISAYEFMCERIDGIYFYYIDANTGEVARTMKLVSVEGVEKLV